MKSEVNMLGKLYYLVPGLRQSYRDLYYVFF